MSITFSIFDTLLEPVFVLNHLRHIVYCNETAAALAGLSLRKLSRGMDFCEIFTFEQNIEWLHDLTQTESATPYKEVSFKSTQDTQGKVQITLQPILNSKNEKNWVIFFRDVTLEERLQIKYRGELEQKESVIKDLEKAHRALENYSKNLEKMVAERTARISQLNQTLTALLESLGQGFFIFNSIGQCLDVYSKACVQTVEQIPNGKFLWEVLKIKDSETPGLQKWIKTIFLELLPFEDLSPLGPTFYKHSEGKSISLEYFPLRSAKGETEGVVVVASDITNLIEAQKNAVAEKSRASMIIKLVQNRQAILQSIDESRDQILTLKEELQSSKYDMDVFFRALHTLKGTSGLLSAESLRLSCHEAETSLVTHNTSQTAADLLHLKESCATVYKEFDQFLIQVEEILGAQVATEKKVVEISVEKLKSIFKNYTVNSPGYEVSQEIYNKLMSEPIGKFIAPYQTISMEIAERLGKNIERPEIKNGEIPIHPEFYKNIFGTLIHAFQNSIDHGIETPEERRDLNKPEKAKISIDFKILKSTEIPILQISISDDGKGINPLDIRKKLAEKGFQSESESEQQVIQHIFDSGISTKVETNQFSGRGIGMNAIKAAANQCGGTCWVESKIYQGTTIFIQIPYRFEENPRIYKKAS